VLFLIQIYIYLAYYFCKSILKKILLISYYWPPSSGSGVQRWMYFAKYLKQFGCDITVICPDEKQASYKFLEPSFLKHVEGIKTIKTKTNEPLKLYSLITTGKTNKGIPQAFIGERKPTLFKKFSRFLRGNVFLPDARKGWNKFAFKAAKQLLQTEQFDLLITTGPPHSTHLVGKKIKSLFNIKWIADFRDPWLELYFNKMLHRTKWAEERDRQMELAVLEQADLVLTVGPSLKQMLDGKLKLPNSKVHFVYSGYDAEKFEYITKQISKEKFVITHLGLLGVSQPIDAFIAAIRELRAASNEVFFLKTILRIIGKVDPIFIDQLKSEVPYLQLEVVDYLQHQAAIQAIADSDLLFNSMPEIDESKYMITGKLAEYIATGNPILCLGNPEGDANILFQSLNIPAQVLDRKNHHAITNYLLKTFKAKFDNNKVYELNVHNGLSKKEVSLQLLNIINSI
jgi:glycosyltransferase involved in cell wall biosynthesis